MMEDPSLSLGHHLEAVLLWIELRVARLKAAEQLLGSLQRKHWEHLNRVAAHWAVAKRLSIGTPQPRNSPSSEEG